MKTKLLTLILALFVVPHAFASVGGYDNTGKFLGHFNDIKCSGGLSCTNTSGKFLMSGNAGVLQNVVSISGDLTVAQCGSTVTNPSALANYRLPEASTAIGCRYTFIVGSVHALNVNPFDGTDQIVLLTNAGGDAIEADAIGESVTLEAIGNDTWAPVGAEKGTWSDVN